MEVHIIAGKDKESSSVEVTGRVQHIITDKERETFVLNGSQLKQAVGKYFGKVPNDAFLHSPTPWKDLYKTHSWPQVETVLVPESAEITGITSEPVILKTQTLTNSSSQKATFTAEITDTVEETVKTTWSTTETIDVSQSIKYEVGFLGTGGGGQTSFSFSHEWGEGGENSKSVTVGSSAGVSIELDPNETVIAELSASRGVMKVRVRYKARLMGITAINYSSKYHGHHFWGLDIASVMSSADVPNYKVFTEDIEVGYYSSGKIEISDVLSGPLRTYRYL